MSRALLAFALALSLGNPAAVLSWTEALFQLVLPMAGQAGNHWDPDGVDAGSLGAPAGTDDDSDVGSHWDPDGMDAGGLGAPAGTADDSDVGSHWDPNG